MRSCVCFVLLSVGLSLGSCYQRTSCKVTPEYGCVLETECQHGGQLFDLENLSGNCTWLLLDPTGSTPLMPTSDMRHVRPTPYQVWMFGSLSVGLISLSGVFGAVLWPIFNSPFYPHVMRVLIGLAVGSLSSTAIFQLIPEGFSLKEHDPDHEYLKVAMYTWFSFWVLFSVEALTKILFGRKKRKNPGATNTNGNCGSMGIKEFELNGLLSPSTGTKRASMTMTETSQKVATVAWIIIFGDGLHNFIDGMSIGAGFTQSIGTGISISIGIACEEFPHELGDFAILIQSGMSLQKALLYNFLSACTSFIGLALGIVLGELEGSTYIFAFAGGLFLYVSLTHLIPELQDMLKESLAQGQCQALLTFVLQNIGILFGSSLLYCLTRYSDEIAIDYSG
ncbi:metal cation symporter ZIP8-like isoform X1 [Macrosteles quadrilineatus]|uniref:metal cation symporter ZIP8-like isoform X1 n=1 Tax=Macrosteles quadrilineatus TaxID=74068 RepID=UPI0023E0B2DD|nr:metal cation symporter ZIP8-like isoform X1 [Macrosteles quadrilineatus]